MEKLNCGRLLAGLGGVIVGALFVLALNDAAKSGAAQQRAAKAQSEAMAAESSAGSAEALAALPASVESKRRRVR